jgi:hypothetical protein
MASPQIFPVSIYSELKSVLEGATLLDYVDKVEITKYRYHGLPAFSHHAIIISPMAAEAMETGNVGHRWVENEILLALLVKPLYGITDAIMGNDKKAGVPVPIYEFDPPKIGILRMYEDVFKTLYRNTLNSAVLTVPGEGELDSRSDFNVLFDDDREGFLMEAKLSYRPRGYPFYGAP